MSKIGKKSIFIPENVFYKLYDDYISFKGPKGENKLFFYNRVNVSINNNIIEVNCNNTIDNFKAYHGLYRSLINKTLISVVTGFEKKLKVIGIGYKVFLVNNVLELFLGYSHSVKFIIPNDIMVKIESKGNVIILESLNYELLGNISAKIRNLKPPEPYNGKGIFYFDEKIKIKEGKSKKS